MSSTHKQWNNIKGNYLSLIEKSLAQVAQSRRNEILNNVCSHLDSKFAELSQQEQNWENFQQIITEMGPPEEYAELLAEEIPITPKQKVGVKIPLAILCLVVLAVLGSYLVYQPLQHSQPIAHWELNTGNGTIAYDSVGNNHGTIHGSTWINQKFVTAIQFNGYNDYIEIPDSTTLDIPEKEITISAWIRPDRIDKRQVILAKSNYNADSWILEINPIDYQNGTINFFIAASGIDGNFGSNTTIDAKQWSHIVGVFDGNERKIYINGQLDTTQYISGQIPSNDEPVRIGGGGRMSRYFEGLIDDVRIYSKALSDQNILGIYQSGLNTRDQIVPLKEHMKEIKFESDDNVLGRWVTVDFVKKIEDFDPGRKHWQGELILNELVFENDGQLQWSNKNEKPNTHQWTKGKVDPLNKRPAVYQLRIIDERNYLFFEWLSGNVMTRGQKPYYYVLKQVPQKETTTASVEQVEQKSFSLEQIDEEPAAFIVSFASVSPLQTGSARELLLRFNKDHPLGVRTHHYRTKIQDGKLIGYICVDSKSDADIISAMLQQNENLKFISIQPATREEFNQYCQNKQVSLTDIQQKTPEQKNSKQIIEASAAPKHSVLGKWIAVDCVKNIGDFNPEQRTYKKRLVLNDLDFTSNQIVYWNTHNSIVKKTSYNKNTLLTVNEHPARYFQNTIDGRDYLFVEWITQEVIKGTKEPDYYVFKRQQESIEPNGQGLISDSSPVGKWMPVDIVKRIEDYIPNKKQWNSKLHLENLTIYENGSTSGPWTWRQDYLWHPEDRTKAHFTIQQMQDGTYLFMEWISGDVTLRGQKPNYYVLKKENITRSTSTSRNKDFAFGANYCTSTFARSLLGSPSRVDMDGRMLRYNNLGVDLLFSRNGPLSEVHFNKGYTGQLDSGISLNSSKTDVFNAYGKPRKVAQTDRLSGRKEERILFEKGSTSRIYYGNHGLIFWFQDNKINQIVMFKGKFSIN